MFRNPIERGRTGVPGAVLFGVFGFFPIRPDFVDIFNAPGSGAALQQKHAAPTTYVAARAGDVIFHRARTVHMAKANTSSQMRRVYTCIFFRDGCTRSSTPLPPRP